MSKNKKEEPKPTDFMFDLGHNVFFNAKSFELARIAWQISTQLPEGEKLSLKNHANGDVELLYYIEQSVYSEIVDSINQIYDFIEQKQRERKPKNTYKVYKVYTCRDCPNRKYAIDCEGHCGAVLNENNEPKPISRKDIFVFTIKGNPQFFKTPDWCPLDSGV
jgi:hypothetical protein